MPVKGTRKIRTTAAVLMLLSGISHVAQLWFRDTDAVTLGTALVGMYYLVLALGLSGRSRFTLWITALSVVAGAVAAWRLWAPGPWPPELPDPLLAFHFAVDVVVCILCLYVLYRTRFTSMD